MKIDNKVIYTLAANMEDNIDDMGDLVLLVRTRYDGGIVRDWMPAMLAVAECGYHDSNGELYKSARIIADDYDMGQWDRSV